MKTADAADDVELDSEAKRLLLEQKKAEARKAIAEARQAEMDALLPDLSVEIPTETLDAGEKGSALGELLAYGELSAASGRMVEEMKQDVGDLDDCRVLLVDTMDLAAEYGAYASLNSLRDSLARATTAAIKRLSRPVPPAQAPIPEREATAGAPTVIPGLAVVETEDAAGAVPFAAAAGLAVSALPTALSLFRSNTTVRGREFGIAKSALTAAMCRELRNAGADVIVAGFTPVPESAVMFRDVEALRNDRDRLAELQESWKVQDLDPNSIELTVTNERLARLYKKRDDAIASDPPKDSSKVDEEIEKVSAGIPALEAKVATARLNVALAQRVLDATDAFITTIHTAPSGGIAPIVTAALWSHFLADDGQQYVVFAESAFSAGESEYEEKVGRDRGEHMGGMALTYLLMDRDGNLKSSGVVCHLGLLNHRIGSDTFERGETRVLA